MDDPLVKPRHMATLMAAFWTLMLALPSLARRKGRLVTAPDTAEAIQLALAVYALSRIATREKAGAILREPFTEPREDVDLDEVARQKRLLSGDEVQPAGAGLQAAVGQLMTCSRCFGVWGAGGLLYLRVLSPDHSKVVTPLLALSGANFFLQAKFSRMCALADEIAQPESNHFPRPRFNQVKVAYPKRLP